MREAPQLPCSGHWQSSPTLLLLLREENTEEKNLNKNTLKENFAYTLEYDVLDFMELFYENHIWKKNK